MSLSLLVVLFALPMFAAVVLGLRFLVGGERRAMLAAAGRLQCGTCEGPLGEQSLALADELWARHMDRVFEQNKDVKLRIVRTLDAVCPKCGARYQYDHERSTFAPVSVRLAFE